jgi:cytochrome c peroxidase
MCASKLKIFIALITTGLVLYLGASSFSDVPPAALPKNAQELGQVLFFDPVLSSTKKVSCASCHNPELAFADTATFSLGVNGFRTGRNTPSIIYLASSNVFFWDGRASSLEAQALGPITNAHEMNLSLNEAVKRLTVNPFYLAAFNKVFGRRPDSVLILKAISDYERSLSIYDSPYDRFLKGNDTAMSPAAIRGFKIFFRESSCGNTTCHGGVNFSSDTLVNIGIYDSLDMGLYNLSHLKEDIGKFKTPTLRNIAVTPPYMHNGKYKTLKEVVEFYNDIKNFPLEGNTHPDVKMQRNHRLTPDEIDDLVTFLEALTDYRYIKKG